jgi:hypothetical protein
VLKNIVTAVYSKGSMITVVNNILWPQWIKLCNYLRSVQLIRTCLSLTSFVELFFVDAEKNIGFRKCEAFVKLQRKKFTSCFPNLYSVNLLIWVNCLKILLSQRINSLNIFRRIRKNAKNEIGIVMSVCLSVRHFVCLHETTVLLLDGFSWICKLFFQDMSRKFSNY